MKHLLISEIYRLKKNKGILVTAILALAFSILLPLFMTLMIAIIESELSIGSLGFHGIHQFCSVLSGGSLISFILFFTTTSYSCDDFKFGTIRNKIITGSSRKSIYLAKLIINVAVGVIIQTVYALLSLLFCSIFLGYDGSGAFAFSDFLNILSLLVSSIFIQITTYSLLTALTANLQKSNKSVLFFVIAMMVVSVLFEVLYFIFQELDLYKVLVLINDLYPTNQINYIMFNELHPDLVILIVVSNILYSLIISIIGLKSFEGKELK